MKTLGEVHFFSDGSRRSRTFDFLSGPLLNRAWSSRTGTPVALLWKAVSVYLGAGNNVGISIAESE